MQSGHIQILRNVSDRLLAYTIVSQNPDAPFVLHADGPSDDRR